MDRRLSLLFAVLLVILVIGQGLVGAPQSLTIWEVWDSIRGK